MKFSNLIILMIFLFSTGCESYKKNKSSELNFKPEKRYNNIGFSLIYDKQMNLKKLDDRSLQIFHNDLKSRSLVKITNPLNNKSLIAEVKSNRVKFSNFSPGTNPPSGSSFLGMIELIAKSVA